MSNREDKLRLFKFEWCSCGCCEGLACVLEAMSRSAGLGGPMIGEDDCVSDPRSEVCRLRSFVT